MNRNFDEIYEEICKTGFEEINSYKMKRNIFFVAFVLLIMCIYIFRDFMLATRASILISLIGLALTFVLYKTYSNKYKRNFKECIIKKMVELYSKKLRYDARAGIRNSEYVSSQFDIGYNNFESEDLIEGFICNDTYIRMSEVKACEEREEVDANGKSYTETKIKFFGLFGIVDVNGKINFQMDVAHNQNSRRFLKSRIEMDSAEFEKTYDLFSADKIRTMQIFTADIIDEINQFKEVTGFRLEIRVLNGNLYFRLPCGECFEAPAVKDIMDRKFLYKYFKMIDSPINIITKILENATETMNNN